jgi:hypothetical protein
MNSTVNKAAPFTLVYPPNVTGRKNVLLIHRGVKSVQTFADSANESTFPIIYSSSSTKAELLAVLRAQSATIDRIAVVFVSDSGKTKSFLDGKSLFTRTESESAPYSENVEFIISLLKEFSVKNIDYLACNTLQYPKWTNYYSILTRETGVIVGASNDKTGNIKYGGNWVMENTTQDVESIYFNKSIKYYSYLLDQPHTIWSSGVFAPENSVISGDFMYVITAYGSEITKISMLDGSIDDSYWGELEFSNAVDLTITGNYMYVLNITDLGAGNVSTITKINLSDGTIDTLDWYVNTMSSANSICTDGDYLYLLFDTSPGIIVRIDIDTAAASPDPIWVTTQRNPTSFAISDDGNYIYVTSYEYGGILKISTNNSTVVDSWSTANDFYNKIVVSGQYLYLTHFFNDGSAANISLFSSVDGSLVQSDWVSNLLIPLGMTISGQYLYVTLLEDGYIVKLNLAAPCFLEGTRILCKVDEAEVYLPVEQLKPGMLVKTLLNGYKKLDSIGKRDIQNPGTDARIQDRLYKCAKDRYPELTEDLFITGCHSILVDSITEKEREDTMNAFGRIYATDDKYRLTAFVDERAEPWNSEGTYTIWHFALENADYYMNYGVYANGLLVETCSLRYMKELSGMQLM